MALHISISKGFNFYQFCYVARIIQIAATAAQVVFIYAESGSLSYSSFLFYMALVGMHCCNVTRRWYYKVDGRYDMREFVRHPQNTTKLQYGIALFSSPVLAYFIWKFVSLTQPTLAQIFRRTSQLSLTSSLAILTLEAYSVVHRR